MDPRSSVRPGQPLALAAEQVNWINRQMRGNAGFGGSAISLLSAPYTWVYAKNTTGADLPRWGVMEITGLEITPTDDDEDAETQQFCSMPVLTGGEIEQSTHRWCVALEPIGDDKVGRVAVAGVVQVRRADVPKLDGALVIWDNDDWALVTQRDALRLGKVATAWNKGTTATVQCHRGSDGQEVTGWTFEAINRFANVSGGGEKWVACALIGSTWHLIAAECD